MDFQQQVSRVFEAEGPLSRLVMEHRLRTGQIQMAQAVAQTMDEGGVLVVEAGTGVGKTFAYLVPALLCGERVLLSTATKALQDQLFRRDIPLLKSVLGVPVHVALLKGRSSYLCQHRLEFARSDTRLDDSAVQQLARVEVWALSTRNGDLAEVDGLDDSAALISAVTSTRENCLGARCPQAAQCHVNLARREAMSADVVVVNHHLFFADLNVRESGVAELLPSVKCVVFDEAHQLNETGVQFLGKQLSSGQFTSLADDLLKVTQEKARGFADWLGLAQDLKDSAFDLVRYFAVRKLTGKLDWAAVVPVAEGEATSHALLGGCARALENLAASLDTVAQTSPDLQMLQARCADLLILLNIFLAPAAAGCVRWLDVAGQVRMVESPLDIASAMQERVVHINAETPSRKSWIFTSATLGHDPELSWFVQSCGLEGASVLKVQSPFDYLSQASLFVPPRMPKPADPDHASAVADLVLQGALILGGRTLVLTTTLRAMRTIGAQLAAALEHHQDIEVLVQGHMPKRELLERFCAQTLAGNRGSILVASVSFWEGIDIPGDALQLLVIDKLPFSPPDDPVQKARAAALELEGKSPFKLLHLPQAAIALKQGAGRLIRRESDRGVLVVCDVRLTQMGYGKQLLKGLPPMARLTDTPAFLDKLEELTRTSTKDRRSDAHP